MRTLLILSAGLIAATGICQDTPPLTAGARTGTAAVPPRPLTPLSPEARADVYMARKMHREAIDVYLQIKPATPAILNKIGIAYHQMGELDTAKRFYQRAVKASPKYAEAINNMGAVEYAKRSYRKAISYYKRALRISPNSASVYSNLGTAWFARKKYREAIENYEKALALDPEIFERRSTQGSMLQERNVQERAKFHYYLAKMYAKAGMIDLALQYIRKALEGGFKEKTKFMEEEEFAQLRALPEFDVLMKMETRVL
jgi:tetratricopeptide (TPR) repeat protein